MMYTLELGLCQAKLREFRNQFGNSVFINKASLTKTLQVLLSATNMTRSMLHEQSICVGLSGLWEANSFLNENPCIIAGLPVAHKYSSLEIQIAFNNLYNKPSTRSMCIQQFNETESLLKKRSSNSPGWKENFLYYFDLESL